MFDPRAANFWQRAKTNPHHGKLAYSVLEIFSALEQNKQDKQNKQNKQNNALKDLSTYWEFYE
tara:strand:- start:608 stop:796 length:189 start_codon:yes stop_codon:yes gene_type:complete